MTTRDVRMDPSEARRRLSALGASKGGVTRAAKLSPAERSRIARGGGGPGAVGGGSMALTLVACVVVLVGLGMLEGRGWLTRRRGVILAGTLAMAGLLALAGK